MSEIKAIETIYNGYKFRSRLEARWAVFFDALGIKYEYEPEGYQLSNGKWYLPDFYFPGTNGFYGVRYAEVKPLEWKGINQEAWHKIEQFAIDIAINKHLSMVILEGPPDFRSYDVSYYWDDQLDWGDDALLFSDAAREDRWFTHACIDNDDQIFRDMECWDKKYIQAVHKARQARFEHGVKPKVRSLIT